MSHFKSYARSSWHVDMLLFGGALCWIAFLALLFRINPFHPSHAPHFVVQGQRWLSGRLDVTGAIFHDTVLIDGKQFIVYPPFPVLLMLPGILLLGRHFSDIWFTWLIGAANTVLLFRVLEIVRIHQWSPRTRLENLLLAIVFLTGTIALWLTLGGAVWFTAQTLAITCLLVMIAGALTDRWFISAIGLGAAFLTRSPDILCGIFVVLPLAVKHGWLDSERLRVTLGKIPPLRTLIALGSPLAITILIYLIHNQLYFHHPLDSGYGLQVAQNYPEIHYGLISLHYLWPNLVVSFLNFPSFHFTSPFDTFPIVDLMQHGNGTSIIFTLPLILWLTTPASSQTPRWFSLACWSAAGLSVGLALLWNGTGWYQVGARYLFDAYPFLFLLLAVRQQRLGWRWICAACWGVFVNIVLAQTFWCGTTTCIEGPGSTRYTIYVLAIIAAITTVFFLWWRSQHDRMANILPGTSVQAPAERTLSPQR